MALPPWRKGIVTRIEQEAPATLRYWIQIPELERFEFVPGQFVTLDLPIHEKPNKRWRSYSIASAPGQGNEFELIIVLNEEGLGTPWIFEHVKVGTELSLRGPQGVFTLPDTIDRDLFLICTGTGVAPFRSMAAYIFEHDLPHHSIYLIFGTRRQEGILYGAELEKMQQEHPSFHYFPVLSREKWSGKEGYVHEVYESLLAEKQSAYFYLCGWKNMIDEAKRRLLALGYDRKSIHQELYG